MKKFFRIIGYTLFTIGAAITILVSGAVIEYNLNYPLTHSLYEQTKSCMKGKFIIAAPKDGGFINAGEVEICGTDMNVSPVYGPSMEAHIEQLRQENAFLRSQLDSCQQKQAL